MTAPERRKYHVVTSEARDAAITTVCKAIEDGTTFTAACRAVASRLDVAETTVRGWVNNSGRRSPAIDYAEVVELRRQLAMVTELNHRLSVHRPLSGR